MSKVFLFTGENRFQLRKDIHARKDAFIQKYGVSGIFEYWADRIQINEIQGSLFGGGLFSTTSLTIIHGLPNDLAPEYKTSVGHIRKIEEFFQKSRDSLNDQNVLVFISQKPDKRTAFYKFLQKNAQLKEFKQLSGVSLRSYISSLAGNFLEKDALEYFFHAVGNNQGNIHHEFGKIEILYNKNNRKKLTKKQIMNVIIDHEKINNFELLDQIFRGEKYDSILSKIQQSGDDIYKNMGMIVWGVKLILSMIDLHEDGIKTSKEMASTLGIHPFAVAKQHKKIGSFCSKKQHLKNFYKSLIHLDYSIKKGKTPEQAQRLQLKSIIYAFSQQQ